MISCLSKLKVYSSKLIDPFKNLSIEENLLRTCASDTAILMLYRNSDSVIIGRNQNPYIECNLENLRTTKTKLVRRFSGGGTVFHDLNNLNISLIYPKSCFRKQILTGLVVDALKQFEFGNIYVNDRNDINKDQFKILFLI